MAKLLKKLNIATNKYLILNLFYFIIGLQSIKFYKDSLIGIYLIVGLFFIVLFIVNFFTTKKIKQYLMIIFFSSILTLYIFEFYVHTSKKYTSNNLVNEMVNIYNTEKNATIATGGYLFLENNNLDLLPLSGISDKKTFLCNEDGFFSSYLSDRYGFNNDDNIYNKKEYIILIGDSYAHGACQQREMTISGYLIKKNLNILNLGYSSSGPLLQYATMREYADLKKATKIYYFFYSGNDIYNDIKREKKNYILQKYLSDKNFSQNLNSKQHILNKIYEDKNNEIISKLSKFNENENNIKSEFNCFIRMCLSRSTKNILFYNTRLNSNENYEEIFRALKEMKAYSESNGEDFIFVYVPNFYEYKFFSNIFYQLQYNRITKNLIEKKITYIDLKKEIISSKIDYLTFYPNKKFGHFNELGYQFISEQIYKFNSTH
jgi:hypothetical protein